MPASLPFSILDLVVIGVVVISALLASVRGATREILAVAAWGVAAVVAYLFHPLILPRVKEHVSNPTIAAVLAIGAIFIVTLVLVSIITVKLSDFILDSRIGALDRTLGFIFGAARGFLICVIGWIMLTRLVQGGQIPEWATTARSRPALDQTAGTVMTMLPDADWMMAQLRKIAGQDKTSPADPTAPTVTPPAAPTRG